MQRLLNHALEVLKSGAGEHRPKLTLLREGLQNVQTLEEYAAAVDASKVIDVVKLRLKETL